MEEKEKIYLRLDSEMAKRFLQIKNYLGVKNDTEAVRSLINWYWREHREELKPRLEHFNLNEDGVLILDRELNRIFQVYFKPDKILCEYCETSKCRHTEFALSIPAVQETLRKKGWKQE